MKIIVCILVAVFFLSLLLTSGCACPGHYTYSTKGYTISFDCRTAEQLKSDEPERKEIQNVQ